MKYKQQGVFLICCFFVNFSMLLASETAKYLPAKIIFGESSIANISYNKDNQISRMSFDIPFGGGSIDTNETLYSYYDNGFIKELKRKSTKTRGNKIDTTYLISERYKYEISDSIINISVNKEYILDNTSQTSRDTLENVIVYLNKDRLPIRYLSTNSIGISSDTYLKYNEKNEVVELKFTILWEDMSSMEQVLEIVEFAPHRGVFGDVNNKDIERYNKLKNIVYFYDDPLPALYKLIYSVDGKGDEVSEITANYELDENGYPIKIIETEKKQGVDSDEENGGNVSISISYIKAE